MAPTFCEKSSLSPATFVGLSPGPSGPGLLFSAFALVALDCWRGGGNAELAVAWAWANLRGMECRAGCGACCIAPSISSPLPGLPLGKPAGVACPHLDDALRCRLFGDPQRPAVCASLCPEPTMCGESREQALAYLRGLEEQTRPLG